jgi:branched-chain amino acid aminotransferase
MLDIKINKTKNPKEKFKPGDVLGFGKKFTDHMFVMNYTEGKGWHDPRIEEYAPISLDPSAMVFHYGQTMFEGMKAYRGDDGKVYLFRPDMNAKRANDSNKRLCIPEIPEEDFVQAVKAVVDVDKDWIPTGAGESLYIRPFVIAKDETTNEIYLTANGVEIGNRITDSDSGIDEEGIPNVDFGYGVDSDESENIDENGYDIVKF